MKKRISAFLLSVVLCFSMITGAFAVNTAEITVNAATGGTSITVSAARGVPEGYHLCALWQISTEGGNTVKRLAYFDVTVGAVGSFDAVTVPTDGPLSAGIWYRVAIASNCYKDFQTTTPAVESITVTPSSVSLKVGGTQQLSITFAPNGASDTFTWSSNDNSIATVSNDGLVTAKSAGLTTVTATTAGGKTATCNVTVTNGNDNSNGGGSSGGSGGGGGGGSSSTTVKKDTNVSVSVTNKDGTATSAVNKTTADKMVSDAVKNKSDNVNLTVKAPDDATKVSTTIPSSSVKKLADKTDSALNVVTPIATVVIPNDAVGELAGKGKNTVGVTVEKSDDGDVKITIQADGKDAGTLSGVKVNIPTDKTGSGNVAVIVNQDGTETIVKKSIVQDGKIIVPINGSATVRIADRSKDFDDISGHWATDSISFVTSRDLFNGVSETEFAPNAQMTRAMFVTVLHRLEDTPAGGSNKFADVPDGTWYTDAVAWAAANGIVNGKSETSFAPNDPITREQLAVILYRYAEGLGLDISVAGSLNDFSDANTVSSYATEAVTWAVGAGIINGKTSTTIVPQGNATRAEVSTMLMRLVGTMN